MVDVMGTESARRVADLLIELGSAVDPVGVNELARRVGISPTVAHRILQALLSRDLAAQEGQTQKYSLGMGALQLGGGVFARLDFRRFARPVLEQLVDETNLTATLSVLTGTRRMYIDQVLPTTELRFSVELGVTYSLTRGSSGRAILAKLPPHVIDRVIDADDEPMDEAEQAVLRRRLEEVRTSGYAVARGERIQGAGGVACAFGASGAPLIGAVNIIGPMHLFTEDRTPSYIAAITRAGKTISKLLSSPASFN